MNEAKQIPSAVSKITEASHFQELRIEEIFVHKGGLTVEELEDWQENSLGLSMERHAEDFEESNAELTKETLEASSKIIFKI